MNQKKFYIKILLLPAIFFCQLSFGQIPQATMQQIQLLLNEKSARTPVQRKIDSRLLQAIREQRGEKMIQGINLEPANVNADFSGVLKVDISANITGAFLSKITALGGQIIYASSEYNTVRASVNLKMVEAIAGYAEVKFIEPAVKYILVDEDMNEIDKATSFADRVAKVRAQLTVYMNKMHPLAGKVTSEGDVTHRANDVRSTFGYQGQGIKIGVLSDSYNAKGGAATNVTNGDLPGAGNPDGDLTPVTVVQDFAGGSDEGRAMLQVIHDLAPKAQLFFATADVSEASFANNIKTLRNTYNCNIIVDDVFYYDEPVFQDGIVAQAVNTVTASGALYFASAGNAGSVAKGTAGVFEGDFNDAGSGNFTGGSKAGTIHNFGTVSSPLNGDIVTSKGLAYNMNWSDPMGASGNDYDLFLVSSSGTIKASSTNIQSGTQNPYEQIDAPSLVSGDRLIVFKTSGAAVRAFHVNTNRGTLTVATGGQTKGHSCAANAFSIAATPAHGAFQSGAPVGPYPNPFISTNHVEDFSSDGPRRKFYNPDGTPITPGNFLFSSNGGTLLAKPDLTAADGVKTTFGILSGLNPFYGTSCAAPHAAAIAALVLSGNTSLTPSQVRTILISTALDIESPGYDYNSGYGIIQAFQAASQVNSVSCGTPATLTSNNVTATSATVSWSTVSGANNYDVDYKMHAASTWTNAATATTNTSINLSGLTAAMLYDWRVRTNCTSGSGNYDTAQFTTTGIACNSTYDGSIHNSFATAVAIPFSTNVNGTISSGTDTDYYKFTITTKGTATVTLSTLPANYDLYIYNGSHSQVASSKNNGTTTETKTRTYGKGTFYLKVLGRNHVFNSTSCYTLNVTLGTATLNAEAVSDANIITDNNFRVFPNPASSVVNISTSKIAKGTSIKIMDALGNTVVRQEMTAYNVQLNISKLAAGTYIVIILDKDGKVINNSKFVKQ